MALVDVIEQLPAAHPKRAVLVNRLKQLGAALASVQDPFTGTFWQVIDAAKREKNYRESSGTALIAYALTKAIKAGFIDDAKVAAAARAAFRGTLEQFVDVDASGQLALKQTCKEPGSGDYSYDHYTGGGSVVNDPLGVGGFVLASLARE
jgi:unsaturated rhamnogalacturonyl hydrolase